MTPGRRVTIRGTVTDFPAPATTVSICRRLSGKLTVLKRLTISASGAFHWKMKAGKPGKSVLVATYSAAGVSFSSKTVTVMVHR